MAINRKRFLSVFLVSNLLFIGVVAAIISGGVSMAVPTAGVGGFTVAFDELDGEGFEQYASIEDNNECAAYPSQVAEIDEGTITGLHLYKDIEVPNSVPGAGGDVMRVSVESDEEVDFQGLTQKFTYMEGDLTFNEGQEITQEPSGDVEDQFGISAPAVTIENGYINAQSQFVESISLAGSTVSMDHNPEDTHDFPEAPCMAENGSAVNDTGDNGTNDTDDDGANDTDENDSDDEAAHVKG